MPVILVSRSLKQEHLKFKASLGYLAKPCLKYTHIHTQASITIIVQ